MWTHEGKPWYQQPVVWGMITVACVESTFLFIQSAKVFNTKSAEDLSLEGFVVFLFTSVLWMIWAIITKDVPVLVAGTLSTTGTSLVLSAILIYGSDSRQARMEKEAEQRRLKARDPARDSSPFRAVPG